MASSTPRKRKPPRFTENRQGIPYDIPLRARKKRHDDISDASPCPVISILENEEDLVVK